jgi:hypothetical protein
MAMNAIIREFNRGFGNCIFMSRDPKRMENLFTEKINETMSFKVTNVKVTPVDELHDKLSLSLEDDGTNVEGVLSWHKATDGVHYTLDANALA